MVAERIVSGNLFQSFGAYIYHTHCLVLMVGLVSHNISQYIKKLRWIFL